MQRGAQWGYKRAIHWQYMHAFELFIGLRIHYLFVGTEIQDTWEANLPETVPGYDVRRVYLADLLPFTNSTGGTKPVLEKEFLEKAFERGDECIAAFYAGQLVSFGFTSRARFPVSDQLEMIIPEGFRCSYKGWTHPEHRGRNLSKCRSKVNLEECPRPYQELSFWYTETHNYASLLHKYRPPRERNLIIGLVGWFSWFGRQIPFNSRQAKRLGIEIIYKHDPGKRQCI